MSAHESNFHLDPQQRVAQLRLELTAAQARQASLEQENDHLRTSLKESLEQQTVTSEILRVIASSPTDLQPVLDAVAENAARVCGADDAIIHRIDGEVLRAVAHHGPVPMFPPIGSPEGLAIRGSITGRAVLERRAIHIHDVAALSEAEFPVARRNQQLTGQRTTLAAPLLREGVPIGTILIRRLDVRPFTDKQIEMLKTFADQAVIAIENTRLFKELEARNRELTEALRHQTATAEILRVINRSPTEAQPVFDAIVEGALQLCDGLVSAVYRLDRDRIHLVAHRNLSAEGLQEFRRAYPLPLSAESLVAQTILDRTAVHVSDAQEDPGMPALARRIASASGYRSVLLVPMLREGTAIGAIGVTRREAGQFSKKQVQLLRTFADQAVIAMENVRLFNELEARNKELTEALEQQTAIAGVLGVISSSPTDLRPVYQAILSNVRQLCEASFAALFLYDGEVLTTAAHQNASPALAEHLRQFRHPPGRQTATRRAALERRPVHIVDVLADPEYTPLPAFLLEGLQTVLSVPMLRERTLVGVITTWRREIKPFTDKQITLLKTFADQAVIAIEGARLFRQLQARNRDLAEALEHRTATNEVLSVMSRSTFDLEPLLETIIENGTRLCGAERGFVYQFDGEVFRLVAAHGASTEFRAFLLQNPVRSGRGSVAGRTALERRTVHIHDVLADAEYDQPDVQQRGGYRTVLGVPMLREGALIGVITWVKSRVEPFSDKQIELVTGFADQAAIAIEHVRLFQELEARTRALTRSVEELRALGEVGEAVGSTLDLQTVLTTIVARAAQLSGSDGGIIYEFDEATQTFHVRATHHVTEEHLEAVRAAPIRLGEGAIGWAGATRATVQVADILDEREPVARQSRHILARLGYRSLLAIPLLREDRLLGGLVVWREERGDFPSGVVSLLETFAAQSVIAIQNARLFGEVQEKSRELEVLSRNIERLYRLSTAMQEPLSLRDQLHRVLENAREVVGIDRFYAWGVAPDGDKLVNLAGAGMSEVELEQFEGREIPLPEAGALYQAYREGVPLVFSEENPLPPELRLDQKHLIPALRTKRFLVVPMIARGATVGLLSGDNKPSGRPIPPQSVNLLQTFASHAAVAIANARLFQAIEDKSRLLEAATRAKSQFLANMSHELRTPLNAILGYTELITDNIYGEVPEKIREVLQRVEQSGRHLLALINDVLDLSKIEAGQLTLALTDYSMDEVVQVASAAVNALAASKNLELVTTVPPDLPLGRGDARRLTQVLLNLVGNAIKFTEVGQVATRVSVSDGAFIVSVADTGPGIAPADQQKIFEEFQQVDSADTRKKGGTGLGLTIARRIIEMHGGRLWVESTPGRGSTFWFTVPIRVEQPVALVRSASTR